MGQIASKENHLLGYKIPAVDLDHEKSIINDNEIRLKDIKIDTYYHMLDLAQQSLYSITPSISLLKGIRKLDLSNNHLNELPDAIGCLSQLEQFSVARNNLTHLPDTICQLSRLKDLELSFNDLQSITPYIGHLSTLKTLYLNHNSISHLPFTLDGLSSLVMLDLSYNPISILPAQITQLPHLRHFLLEGCSLLTSLDYFDLIHDPPSLLEICAKIVISSKKSYSLTESLNNYLSHYNICNHCRGPYFDSFVSRARWLERNDGCIPLEYRLCSAHWSDESDRVLATFSCSFSHETPVKPFYEQKPSPALLKNWRHKLRTTSKKSRA